VNSGQRETAAVVKIQSFVRGKNARVKVRVDVEQRQQDTMLRNQLAERHNIGVEQLPTKMEISEACRELGIDPLHAGDKEFVWLAEEYLLAPLPKGWTEMYLAQYKAVAYISEQGTSSWAHPSKGYYIGLVRELRRLRAEYMFVAKDGLFAVAKVGAKIQAVLNAHTEEQTRVLKAEADQLAGAEWTESTYVVDGAFVGAHLTNTVAKHKAHTNAYDPRRVTMKKIRDKREKVAALEESGDSASQGLAQDLEIEIALLEEDLREQNARADRSLESESSELVAQPRPGGSVTSDGALEDALASLPALPGSSHF
jgi:hypothetical protein